MLVRHDWPMPNGFTLLREQGHELYVFFHFHTPVSFKLRDKTIEVEPGGCIFVEPGVPHSFYSKEVLSHSWIVVKDVYEHLLHKYNIPFNQIVYPKDDSFISRLCLFMENEYFNEKDNKDDMIEAYFNEFLIKFMRELKDNNNNNNVKNIDRTIRNKMRMARQQFLATPEHNWTVNKMAALIPISSSRFYALYKALFYSTPTHDLIFARIDYASSLLIGSPELSIADIAEKVGYNDQYHFIRQFKEIKGTSPGKYRKNFTF